MAIKTITKGQKPEDRVCRGTCNNCHSVIECLASDARDIFDKRDGNYLQLKCPECQRPMSVYPVSETKTPPPSSNN